ncbi:MAG: rhomboid family intramembrane serine protease [Sandaracinaceae bacterium]
MTALRQVARVASVLGLLLALAFVFVMEAAAGWGEGWTLRVGDVRDALLSLRQGAWPEDPTVLWTLLTHAFLHANLGHLLNNAALLWLFGLFLVPVVGNRGVVLVFLVTAVAGAAGFLAEQFAMSERQMIGASGAVSGLLGFYLLLAFRWELPDAHAPPLSRPIPARQAAVVAIIATAMDFYVVVNRIPDGVAHSAHLGGFFGGLVLAGLLTTFFSSWQGFRTSAWGPRLATLRLRGGRWR